MLGGTFDPIHSGHCEILQAAAKQMNAQQALLLPSFLPVHREAQASAEQRLNMIKAAIANYPALALSTLEIERAEPSYSIDTVTRLRQSNPDSTLVFLLGMDAFRGFDTWRCWQDILSYVHLGVVKRPGVKADLSPPVAAFLAEHQLHDISDITAKRHGGILFMDIEGPDISATALRERCARHQGLAQRVPAGVAEIITEEQLYQNEKTNN